MDGVGGTLKRMADEHVLRGCDVTNASDFTNLFQESSITVLKIEKDEVSQMKKEFPSRIIPIQGIMQVHQIVWSVGSNIIFSRKLSCFNCLIPSQTCNHYGFSKHEISSSKILPHASGDSDQGSGTPGIALSIANVAICEKENNLATEKTFW